LHSNGGTVNNCGYCRGKTSHHCQYCGKTPGAVEANVTETIFLEKNSNVEVYHKDNQNFTITDSRFSIILQS
jgi:hypothetical protein